MARKKTLKKTLKKMRGGKPIRLIAEIKPGKYSIVYTVDKFPNLKLIINDDNFKSHMKNLINYQNTNIKEFIIKTLDKEAKEIQSDINHLKNPKNNFYHDSDEDDRIQKNINQRIQNVFHRREQANTIKLDKTMYDSLYRIEYSKDESTWTDKDKFVNYVTTLNQKLTEELIITKILDNEIQTHNNRYGGKSFLEMITELKDRRKEEPEVKKLLARKKQLAESLKNATLDNQNLRQEIDSLDEQINQPIEEMSNKEKMLKQKYSNIVEPLYETIRKYETIRAYNNLIKNTAILDNDGNVIFAENANDFWEKAWPKKCKLLTCHKLSYDEDSVNFELHMPQEVVINKNSDNNIIGDGEEMERSSYSKYTVTYNANSNNPNCYKSYLINIEPTIISRVGDAFVSFFSMGKSKTGGKTIRKKRSRYHKQRKH
jgi:hypothetical protein